jgi:hypothetical protein
MANIGKALLKFIEFFLGGSNGDTKIVQPAQSQMSREFCMNAKMQETDGFFAGRRPFWAKKRPKNSGIVYLFVTMKKIHVVDYMYVNERL